MILEPIYESIHTDNTILLNCQAREEVNSNIIDLFSFRTGLMPGVKLERLKDIIIREFQFRYGNCHSVFFRYESFMNIINLVYALDHDERFHPLDPLLPIHPVPIAAQRARIYEDAQEAPYLPFVVEFNVLKEREQPVSIRSIWYYEDGREDRYQEIISEINPIGMEWEFMTKRFINHTKADLFNTYVQQYKDVFISSVLEELHDELDAIDLAEAEQNSYSEEDFDGEDIAA